MQRRRREPPQEVVHAGKELRNPTAHGSGKSRTGDKKEGSLQRRIGAAPDTRDSLSAGGESAGDYMDEERRHDRYQYRSKSLSKLQTGRRRS